MLSCQVEETICGVTEEENAGLVNVRLFFLDLIHHKIFVRVRKTVVSGNFLVTIVVVCEGVQVVKRLSVASMSF